MSKIGRWSTTAANNNSASPDGFPENMAPSGVNNSEREVMAQLKTWHDTSEWRDLNENYTVAYASATTFTIAGVDLTAVYPANRRVKCVDATDLYGYVSSSAFATNTTVTVVLDSGSLSASLTEVFVGIDPTNKSLPQNVPYKDVVETITQSWIFTGAPVFTGTNTYHRQSASSAIWLYFQNSTTGTTTFDGLQIGIDANEDAVINQREAQSIIFATSAVTRGEIASNGGWNFGTGLTSQGAGTINVLNDIYVNDVKVTPGLGALVASNANQSISDVTLTTVQFNTEQYDDVTIHDNATNNTRLTVPTGYTRVELTASIEFAAAAGGFRYAQIIKNGTTFVGMPIVKESPYLTSSSITLNLKSPVLAVSATDYFEVQVYQDTGSALNVLTGNFTWFSMRLLK